METNTAFTAYEHWSIVLGVMTVLFTALGFTVMAATFIAKVGALTNSFEVLRVDLAQEKKDNKEFREKALDFFQSSSADRSSLSARLLDVERRIAAVEERCERRHPAGGM